MRIRASVRLLFSGIYALAFSACSGPLVTLPIQVGSPAQTPLVQVGPATQPAPAIPPAVIVSGCDWAKPVMPDPGYLKRWTLNELRQEDKALKIRAVNCPPTPTPKPEAK